MLSHSSSGGFGTRAGSAHTGHRSWETHWGDEPAVGGPGRQNRRSRTASARRARSPRRTSTMGSPSHRCSTLLCAVKNAFAPTRRRSPAGYSGSAEAWYHEAVAFTAARPKRARRESAAPSAGRVRGRVCSGAVKKKSTFFLLERSPICDFYESPPLPPPSALTREFDVRGMTDPIWMRKVFNYFRSL